MCHVGREGKHRGPYWATGTKTSAVPTTEQRDEQRTEHLTPRVPPKNSLLIVRIHVRTRRHENVLRRLIEGVSNESHAVNVDDERAQTLSALQHQYCTEERSFLTF